jgi:methylglutaconyl-CoA hydratase
VGLKVTEDDRGVVTLTLDRPEVRNAFGPELMDALRAALDALAPRDDVRVVILTGAGTVFSAGADLTWMRSMVEYSYDEQIADSRQLDALFHAVNHFPAPVVARVNGHALAGATGLVACSDVVVAVRDAKFGFTEARLGLAPAVISTYVQPKLGIAAARRYFLTGELFDAEQAHALGLVHEVCDPDDLDDRVAAVVDALLAAAPGAQRAIKELIPRVAAATEDEARELTVPVISRLRVSEEGQEGMRSFFEKRAPSWTGKA